MYYDERMFRHCPQTPSTDKLTEMAKEFRRGDFKNKRYFIESLCLFAVRVGYRTSIIRYRHINHDAVSESLLALAAIPDEIHQGKLTDNNVLGFVRCRCITRCTQYLKHSKGCVHIPASSRNLNLKGTEAAQYSIDSDNASEESNNSCTEYKKIVDKSHRSPIDAIAISEFIKSCPMTLKETQIMKLLKLGHSNVEIGKQTGMTPTNVATIINRIKANNLDRYLSEFKNK